MQPECTWCAAGQCWAHGVNWGSSNSISNDNPLAGMDFGGFQTGESGSNGLLAQFPGGKGSSTINSNDNLFAQASAVLPGMEFGGFPRGESGSNLMDSWAMMDSWGKGSSQSSSNSLASQFNDAGGGGKGSSNSSSNDISAQFMRAFNAAGGGGGESSSNSNSNDVFAQFTQAFNAAGGGGCSSMGISKDMFAQFAQSFLRAGMASKGCQKGGKGAGKVFPDTWKSRLFKAYMAKYGRRPSEEFMVYAITKTEGGLISCNLTCAEFKQTYSVDGVIAPRNSKKVAEEAVAMKALEAEFPDVYSAIPESVKIAEKPGEKRNPRSDFALTPKTTLNNGLMLLAGRTPSKEEIKYETTEICGKHVGFVMISCLEEVQTFQGKPSWGPKEAEHEAAKVAIDFFKARFDGCEPANQAKKARREAEMEEKRALWNQMKSIMPPTDG